MSLPDESMEPSDYLSLTEPYLSLSAGYSEVVGFEGRLAALIWLHRATTHAVGDELVRLAKIGETGSHRVLGWDGECDAMLHESILLLEMYAAPVAAGAIVAACCSALESLFTDLLVKPGRQGLRAKAAAICGLIADRVQAESISADVEWLAARRNSFAHRLIDEGGLWNPDREAERYVFDDATVEEAFVRCGSIATILDERYDDIARARRAGK
jgi:hypothetical protein